MGTILVLEDEESMNRGVTFTLKKEGHQVESCLTLQDAKKVIETMQIQLAICDINLPDGSGLDFIKLLKRKKNCHIIALTALDQEVDQVMGYEAGADDYITKPFSLSVLALKVNAYFRKVEGKEQSRIVSGNVSFDILLLRAYVDDVEISLTKNEWKLLRCFMNHPKQILTKNQLLEQLFDQDGEFVDENTIAVNIRRLREKIEPDSSKPSYIKNIRGIGYVWDMECRKC